MAGLQAGNMAGALDGTTPNLTSVAIRMVFAEPRVLEGVLLTRMEEAMESWQDIGLDEMLERSTLA